MIFKKIEDLEGKIRKLEEKIKEISGITGTARDVVEKLKIGKLKSTSSADVLSHFGIGF